MPPFPGGPDKDDINHSNSMFSPGVYEPEIFVVEYALLTTSNNPLAAVLSSKRFSGLEKALAARNETHSPS